jgi:hypothetical protein
MAQRPNTVFVYKPPTLDDVRDLGQRWIAGTISKFGAMRYGLRHLELSAEFIRKDLWSYDKDGERSIAYAGEDSYNKVCSCCGARSLGNTCATCRDLDSKPKSAVEMYQ